MRLILALLTAMVSAGALQAQVPVSGRVLSAGGQPVPDAKVILIAPRVVLQPGGPATPVPTAATNARGEFEVSAAAAGRYTIAVEKPEWVTHRASLILEVDKPARNLTIRLSRASSIRGRITDAGGNPIPSAQVTAFRYSYARGRRQLTAAGYTIGANAAGEYSLANLTAGRYYVRVEAKEDRIATFYAQTADMLAAAPIDLTEGEQRQGVDIRQRVEPTYSIRGKAIDTATGGPAINAALTIRNENAPETLNPPTRTPTAAPDGTFEFKGLTAGSYVIQAIPNGNVMGPNRELIPAVHAGRAVVQLNREDIEDLVLRVDAGVTITGRVRMENDESLPAAQPAPPVQAPPGVSVDVGVTGPRVMLMDSDQVFTMGDLAGKIEEDGSFRIEKIPPSRYSIQVPGFAGDVFVQSVRSGTLDLTRAPLDLTNGAPGPIDIVIATKAAAVAAVVRDRSGMPMAGVAVALWPDEPDQSNYRAGVRTSTTDENGIVNFVTIRPGKYHAAAFQQVEPAFLGSPDFLDRFRTKATALDLNASETRQATLEPISKDESDGVIRGLP